jgi:hypothetical protein
MNDITDKLAEALRRAEACMTNDGVGKQAREALRLYEQEKPAKPVAWRTFDGEGGYEYRSYADNEDYASEWAKLNPKHVGWVESLFAAPVAQAEPPHTLPDSMSRDEMLRYYSEYANLVHQEKRLAAPVARAAPNPDTEDAEALRSATKHDIRLDYGSTCEGQHHPGVVRATYPLPRTSLRGLVAVEYLPESALLDPHPDGEHINMGRHYLTNYPGKYVVGIDAAVRQAICLAIHDIMTLKFHGTKIL